MNIFSQADPVYLLLAGSALLTWTLIRRARKGLGRRRDGGHLDHLPRPIGKWDGAQKDAAAMLERKQVELHDVARDVSGQIDCKMILLEQLMAQSQRQIDQLEKLLAEAKATQRIAANLR